MGSPHSGWFQNQAQPQAGALIPRKGATLHTIKLVFGHIPWPYFLGSIFGRALIQIGGGVQAPRGQPLFLLRYTPPKKNTPLCSEPSSKPVCSHPTPSGAPLSMLVPPKTHPALPPSHLVHLSPLWHTPTPLLSAHLLSSITATACPVRLASSTIPHPYLTYDLLT